MCGDGVGGPAADAVGALMLRCPADALHALLLNADMVQTFAQVHHRFCVFLESKILCTVR